MIAAVKVRGDVDARQKVVRTLQDLELDRKNQVRLMEDNDVNRGMLNVVKDYVAYGEIGDETIERLQERTGEISEGDVINLPPPSGGYKNTKKNTGQGGSLGKHENLDQILLKMV